MMQESQFQPARARAVAQRLRDGTKPKPMFTRDIKKPGKGGVVVITNIGSKADA